MQLIHSDTYDSISETCLSASMCAKHHQTRNNLISITCGHCRQRQKSQRRVLHLPDRDHLPPALLMQPFSICPCTTTAKLCFQLCLQNTSTTLLQPSKHNRRIPKWNQTRNQNAICQNCVIMCKNTTSLCSKSNKINHNILHFDVKRLKIRELANDSFAFKSMPYMVICLVLLYWNYSGMIVVYRTNTLQYNWAV